MTRPGPGPGTGFGAPSHGPHADEVPPDLLTPRNGAGRAAAVCGVLALISAVLFFLILTIPLAVLLGIFAILLGMVGRMRVRRGLATNRGTATTGLVTGLLSLLLLVGVGVAAVTFWHHNSSKVKNIGQCLQQAGTDAKKLQDCQDRFKSDLTQ
jgi:hypothetical protein